MLDEMQEAKREARKIRAKLYKETIIAITFLCVLSILFIEQYLPVLLGLVIGTIVAMINFTLIMLTLEKADNMLPRNAQLYAISRYIFIYALYGIAIYISVRYGTISIMGMIIGVLSINIVVYITKAIENRKSSNNKI